MRENSLNNFGLIAAFLVPGFIALIGLSYLSPDIASWLGTTGKPDSPTLGGFLYVTIASIALGMIVSTVRWMVIDSIHYATGIPRPDWDFAKLQQNIQAFERLIEIHYRFYLFNANGFVALLFFITCRAIAPTTPLLRWADLLWIPLLAVLFIGSRDCYRKYVVRVDAMLKAGIDTSQ